MQLLYNKKMNWPLDSYYGDHPLQIEIFRIVSEPRQIPSSAINAERDGGAILFKTIKMSSYIHFLAVPKMLN